MKCYWVDTWEAKPGCACGQSGLSWQLLKENFTLPAMVCRTAWRTQGLNYQVEIIMKTSEDHTLLLTQLYRNKITRKIYPGHKTERVIHFGLLQFDITPRDNFSIMMSYEIIKTVQKHGRHSVTTCLSGESFNKLSLKFRIYFNSNSFN